LAEAQHLAGATLISSQQQLVENVAVMLLNHCQHCRCLQLGGRCYSLSQIDQLVSTDTLKPRLLVAQEMTAGPLMG
jgi:hypothetical protein